ncbi:MAG: HEAT repeat domain-containing protein [Chloroflexota bacterium]|nr:HEAT repeat domain-containing protein [Chloroflexota bacterium]
MTMTTAAIAQWIASLDDTELAERASAESALIAAGADAHAALIDASHSPTTETRWRAASALGDSGATEAIDRLIALLTDPTWDVRSSAAYSLGMLADARGFDALNRAAFHTAPDEQTPYVAALGLLRIDRARARPILDAALTHADEPIRRTAMSALAVDRWRGDA